MSIWGAPKTTRQVEVRPDRVATGNPGRWFHPSAAGLPKAMDYFCLRTVTEIVWRRWRERNVVHTCSLAYVVTDGEPMGDDEWIGAGFYWQWSSKPGPWENMATQKSVRTVYETRFFDPPRKLPQWRFGAGPDLTRGSLVSMETDWLRKIPEVRSFRATFDGHPYRGGAGAAPKAIDTSTLEVGCHAFDLDIHLRNGGRRAYQITFNVIPRFNIWFENPIVDADLNGLFGKSSKRAKNGAMFPITIQNNTNDILFVVLEIADVPSGWRGAIPRTPIVRVPPRKRVRANVIAEIMSDMGLSGESLLPVSVFAYTGVARDRSRLDLQAANCFIRPVLDRKILRSLLAVNRRYKAKNVPKVY